MVTAIRLPRLRSRATAMALAVAIELLLILALLGLFDRPRDARERSIPTIVVSLPARPKAAEKTLPAEAPAARAAPKRPETPPVAPRREVVLPVPSSSMITLSREDFAASDIGKLPRASAGQAAGTAAASPGEGPGGQTLYPAEWYRRPGKNALASYLPNGAPPGAWAVIACRTIERYHVDNCVGMGESHRGLSSALRQAAWQFLVLPPRIDGKAQVGSWVRIRFDFTESGAD